MRISRACIVLFVFASSLVPQLINAEEYSLTGLYRIALTRSEILAIAREDISFSELEKNRALSALIPRLSAFSKSVRFTEEKTSDSMVLIQPKTADQWGGRVDQTLSLSLREVVAYKMASTGVLRSTNDLEALQESYLLLVAEAYYNVFMAKKQLDIAQSNLDRVTKYREAALSRMKVGEITKTVLLRADSELSGAKSDLVRAENAYIQSNAALARLVGIGTGFTLKEEIQQEEQIPSLPDLKETASYQRPDLKSLEHQVKMADQQVSYAKGAYWPDITLSGVYERTDHDPEGATLLNPESAYAALLLSFPFFEGGLRWAEVQQAKVRKRQAVLRYEDRKKAIGLEVENAYLNLTTLKGTLTFLQDQAAFAQENYRGVLRLFSSGMASSIDVIDANNLLVSSERQLAETIYSYQLAILTVRQATGTFMSEIREKLKSND